jgi:GxxExxY protein
MMKINAITDKIINAAIDVHKTLGPGLLETLYEEALCYELRQRDLEVVSQKTLAVPYKDIVLKGKFRLDLIVEDRVVVELKNVEKILPIHEAQTLTYLKITNKKTGLILNFNAPLMKDGIKRMSL